MVKEKKIALSNPRVDEWEYAANMRRIGNQGDTKYPCFDAD